MLISLIVLSLEQIYVPFWVSYDIVYSGPITLLEPLVVLIGRRHKDMLVKSSDLKREGRGGEVSCWTR